MFYNEIRLILCGNSVEVGYKGVYYHFPKGAMIISSAMNFALISLS